VQAVDTGAEKLMAVFDLFKRLVNPDTTGGERRADGRLRATLGARILVVDDSATIRAVLGKMLMQDGYEVLKAGDGETAIEMAQSQFPDLIFLDIVLPGASGFSVLRSMRRDTRTRTTPIVMMSGNQQATEQFYVQRFGADGFVKKPFGRVEVFHAIRALVQAGRMPARVIASEPPAAIPEGISPEEWAAIPDVAMPDDEHVGATHGSSGDAPTPTVSDEQSTTPAMRSPVGAEVESGAATDAKEGISAHAQIQPGDEPPAPVAAARQTALSTERSSGDQDVASARSPVTAVDAHAPGHETAITGLAVSMAIRPTLTTDVRATPGPRITVHVDRPHEFAADTTGDPVDALVGRTREGED
jgi:twitching motility two-component system response regulator PilH